MFLGVIGKSKDKDKTSYFINKLVPMAFGNKSCNIISGKDVILFHDGNCKKLNLQDFNEKYFLIDLVEPCCLIQNENLSIYKLKEGSVCLFDCRDTCTGQVFFISKPIVFSEFSDVKDSFCKEAIISSDYLIWKFYVENDIITSRKFKVKFFDQDGNKID